MHGKDGQVINRPHDLARWTIMEERDVYKVKGLGRENWEVNFCACSLVKLFDVKVFENPCGYIKVVNIRKILQAAPTLRPHLTAAFKSKSHTLLYFIYSEDFPISWGIKHRLVSSYPSRIPESTTSECVDHPDRQPSAITHSDPVIDHT
jgi:hypothetical protein